MDKSQITNISFGNNFRIIQTKLIDLVEEEKITPLELRLFIIMLKYTKPMSTELSITTKELAQKTGIRHNNLKARQLKSLINNNLVIMNDNKLFINLHYAARGTKNYKSVCDICKYEQQKEQPISTIGF